MATQHDSHDAEDPSRGDRRVAYVISLFTQDSTFVIREIDELLARGWDIRVFSLKPPRVDRAALRSRAYYSPFLLSPQVLRSVFYYLIHRPATLIRIVCVVSLHFWRKPDLLIRNLAVLPKSLHHARTIETLRCNHIHAHWATVSTFAALSISRVTGIPFSFTGHAWDIFVDTTMLAHKIEAATAVVTCTEYNRCYLESVVGDVATAKIRRIYHGLRLEEYTPRTANPSAPFRMISVGRWVRQKGFSVLIRALDVLKRQGVQFEMVIVASPRDRAYERMVRSLIQTLDLSEHVKTIDSLPQAALVELVKNCSLMVLAAVQDEHTGAQDGIPNVLIESLAVGTPVVSSRLSGIPELVREGYSGVLVPAGDHEALASALAWCAANAETLKTYGENGRHIVHREFDLRKNVVPLERIFARDE
jgi:colanic acid/amylovoran biosynthesis glycosyltransferase